MNILTDSQARISAESRKDTVPPPVDESDLTIPAVHKRTHDPRSIVRRPHRRWIVLGTGLVAGIGILAWIASERFSQHDSEETDRTSLLSTIADDRVYAVGRLEPKGEVISVAGPEGTATARIKKVRVGEGDHVVTDTVLAVLDSESRLLAERDTAERRVRKAQAILAQTCLLVESTRLELLASLETAKISRDTEKSSFERQNQLRQTNSTPVEQWEQARRRLEAAEQNIREIDARLTRYRADDDSVSTDVLVAEEELAVLEGALKECEARMEHAYVRAPISGVILDIHKRPGEPIGQSGLLDMGDTKTMYARVDVYETDVRRIRSGQSVVLTSSAVPKPFHGHVEYISSMVKRQSVIEAIPAANTDARVLEVLVRLDQNSAASARQFIGLQVRAEFLP